jgi:cysteinyl-tRNA synthetase
MVEAALELHSLRQHLAPHHSPAEHGREFLEALADDLNTPGAIAELHRLARATLSSADAGAPVDAAALQTARARFANALALLGLDNLADFDAHRMLARVAGRAPVDEEAVRTLIEARNAARKAKDFRKADAIREQLLGLGVQLKDAKDPVTGEIRTTWELSIAEATEVER